MHTIRAWRGEPPHIASVLAWSGWLGGKPGAARGPRSQEWGKPERAGFKLPTAFPVCTLLLTMSSLGLFPHSETK